MTGWRTVGEYEFESRDDGRESFANLMAGWIEWTAPDAPTVTSTGCNSVIRFSWLTHSTGVDTSTIIIHKSITFLVYKPGNAWIADWVSWFIDIAFANMSLNSLVAFECVTLWCGRMFLAGFDGFRRFSLLLFGLFDSLLTEKLTSLLTAKYCNATALLSPWIRFIWLV